MLRNVAQVASPAALLLLSSGSLPPSLTALSLSLWPWIAPLPGAPHRRSASDVARIRWIRHVSAQIRSSPPPSPTGVAAARSLTLGAAATASCSCDSGTRRMTIVSSAAWAPARPREPPPRTRGPALGLPAQPRPCWPPSSTVRPKAQPPAASFFSFPQASLFVRPGQAQSEQLPPAQIPQISAHLFFCFVQPIFAIYPVHAYLQHMPSFYNAHT